MSAKGRAAAKRAGIEYTVDNEGGRWIVRDSRGRKLGDFGNWDAAMQRAETLEAKAIKDFAGFKWLGL